MSNRLDQEREAKLQPLRMQTAVDAITHLDLEIISRNETTLIFKFKGYPVTYYPYSGWFTGVPVVDGRGLANLLKQITKP